MTLTKDDIDLAEQEFVLCWRDSVTLLGDAIMHPEAIGYEYRWEEICDAARRGISQPYQFPDAGQKLDLSGKMVPEGGSGELVTRLDEHDWRHGDSFALAKKAAARIRELEEGYEPMRRRMMELEAENLKLREALQSIVDYPDLAANAPHIARGALQKEQGE